MKHLHLSHWITLKIPEIIRNRWEKAEATCTTSVPPPWATLGSPAIQLPCRGTVPGRLWGMFPQDLRVLPRIQGMIRWWTWCFCCHWCHWCEDLAMGDSHIANPRRFNIFVSIFEWPMMVINSGSTVVISPSWSLRFLVLVSEDEPVILEIAW